MFSSSQFEKNLLQWDHETAFFDASPMSSKEKSEPPSYNEWIKSMY